MLVTMNETAYAWSILPAEGEGQLVGGNSAPSPCAGSAEMSVAATGTRPRWCRYPVATGRGQGIVAGGDLGVVHIDRVRPPIGGDTGVGAPQGGVTFGGDREIHTGVGCGGGPARQRSSRIGA